MQKIKSAYSRFCEERFPLPTEEQVVEVERRIGMVFPADYRQFLLNYNGGFFSEPDIVQSAGGCPQDSLAFMNGICATQPCAELASMADLALFDDNKPPQVMPIGYTLMGNLILIIMFGHNKGSIVMKKAHQDEYVFLTESIERFFGLLREPTD